MGVRRTVNSELYRATVRHAVFLERLKRAEVAGATRFLQEDVLPQLAAAVERRVAAGMGAWTTARQREMLAALLEIAARGTQLLAGDMGEKLVALAEQEADWQAATLGELLPVNLTMAMPTAELLRSIVEDRPFQGELMFSWMEKVGTSTVEAVALQVRVGMASGETVPQIMSRIRGSDPDVFRAAFNGSTLAKMNANAAAVVRTSIAHVSNDARDSVFRENADVIKGVQMVATLDDRTTEFCMGIDGQVFPVDSGPRPPFHWNCRTVAVPVTKSWRELGHVADKLKDAPAGDRASMFGEVPASLTFDEWLRTQAAGFQDDVLGVRRAEAFRGGEKLVRFTDRGRAPSSVAELARVEGVRRRKKA